MRPLAPFFSTRPLKGLVLLCLLAGGLLAPVAPVVAQETFMTQSGGRGLQNAKTNARLSKAEKDVGDLQTEMAKVKPHAKEEIVQCSDTGAKLRWDGVRWTCDQETDPTVQRWAKEALPSCQPGALLSVQGGNFSCNTSGFVSAETDPTVQNFAKSPLPLCGTGDVLAVGADGSLTCRADEKGLTAETDPLVHGFARTDVVPVVQNCNNGEVLKMVNARLVCVVDEKGITAEVDPYVQNFARTDIAGYNLAACATGEILTSIDSSGKVILQCTAGGDALGEALDLDDLRDVTVTSAASDEVLRFNGSEWVNSNDKIGSLNSGSMCRSTGTEIICDQGAPSSCGAGEFLKWNGTAWVCESAATGLAPSIKLEDLGDVTLTTPVEGHVLTWDGTAGGWVNREKFNISYGDSEVRVVDSVPGTGLIQLIPDGVAILTATNGRVGIRTNSPTTDLDVNGVGLIRSNLLVGGNLTVGGNVSFTGSLNVEGVTFADGGIVVSGTMASDKIAANEGNITSLTTQHVSVTANQDVAGDVRIAGNLYVSGSQTFDGVTFANGGIQVSGTLSSSKIAANEGTIVSLTAQDVSVTRNMTVAGGLSAANVGANNLLAGTVTATNAAVTNDLRVGGNLYVSGSQSIDGVLFANGGITASEGTFVSLTAQDVSVTRNQTVAGSLGMGSGYTTGDFRVGGNFYVSGSQSIDGVVFANGGVSATGTISATRFAGDGSGLTGIGAPDRVVSGTTSLIADNGGSITISTAGTQRMVVRPDGKIAIGGNHVDTWGVMAINGGLIVNNDDIFVSDSKGLRFGDSSVLIRGDSSVDQLSFWSNSVERMRLNNLGYLGVNNLNPNAEVDVIGRVSATNISVSNIVTANGAAFTTLAANSAGLGQLAATSATVTGDLRVGGNFYVSGSQSIDGVTFANGGVSATGTVSATRFAGDGSGITNLDASNVKVATGTSGSVVYRTQSGTLVAQNGLIISGTQLILGTPPSWLDSSYGVYSHAISAQGNIITFGELNLQTSGQALKWGNGNVRIAGDHTNGNMMLVTSNTEVMRITSDSRVGIGTSAPWQHLTVGGNIAANGDIFVGNSRGSSGMGAPTGNSGQSIYFPAGSDYDMARIQTTYNGSSTSMTISVQDDPADEIYIEAGHNFAANGGVGNLLLQTGGGKVGIGTRSPNAELDVSGTIRGRDLRLSGNLYVSGSQSIDGVVFANGGVSATGTVSATRFSGDGSGLTGITGDRIVSGTTGVVANQNQSVTIATAGSDRLVVGTNGRVGIGVANPQGELDISGTLGRTYFDGNNIYMTRNSTNYLVANGGANAELAFRTGGNNTRMKILNNGRVVMGTDVQSIGPSSTLHVVGVSDSTGGLTIGTAAGNRMAMYPYGQYSTAIQALDATGNIYFFNSSGNSIAWMEGSTRRSIFGTSTSSASSTLHVVGVSDSTGGITIGTATERRAAFYPVGTGSAAIKTFGGSFVIADSLDQAALQVESNRRVTIGQGGTTASSTLHVMGVSDSTGGITVGTALGNHLAVYPTGASSAVINLPSAGSLVIRGGAGATVPVANFNSTLRSMIIGGDATPSVTMHVSGTLRISSGGDACDADRVGGIRYAAGVFEFCDAGAVWKSIGALASAGGVDRIVSGTTSVVANQDGYISLTTGGVNTGYFDTAGRLVVPFISTTTGVSTFYDVMTIRQQSNGSGAGLHIYSPGNSTGRFYMNNTSMVVGRGSTPTLVITNAGDKMAVNPPSSAFIPSSTLHLVGVSDSTGGITVGTATESRAAFYPYGNNSAAMRLMGSGGQLIFLNHSQQAIARFDNDSLRVIIGSSATPSETLHVAGNAKVSGTVQVAGTGAETCGAGDYGKTRYVDIGGGVFKMQACRP